MVDKRVMLKVYYNESTGDVDISEFVAFKTLTRFDRGIVLRGLRDHYFGNLLQDSDVKNLRNQLTFEEGKVSAYQGVISEIIEEVTANV